MVFFRNIAIAAASILGLSTAAPTVLENRQAEWQPGTLNNTQEFYLHMTVTDGDTKYNGWKLSAYHTGAGLADPVFTNGTGTRAYLNGTNLQFDVSAYPFGANAFPSDTNYARWEPVDITAGYGQGGWVNKGSAGLRIDNEEHDGWIVCEWYHGFNAPQLFQMIKYFDVGEGYDAYDIPSSCARVLLFPVWI